MEFIFKKDCNLNNFECKVLISAYHKLFVRINGKDLADSFLSLIEDQESNLYKNWNSLSKKNSENEVDAKKAIYEILNNDDIDLLLIYDNNNLIGASRLKNIDAKTVKILDIAITNVSREEEIEIWIKLVKYVERYFKKLGYQKLYLEIPLCEMTLLQEASELGFKEDPKDIIVGEEQKTYLVNKNIGEFNE